MSSREFDTFTSRPFSKSSYYSCWCLGLIHICQDESYTYISGYQYTGKKLSGIIWNIYSKMLFVSHSQMTMRLHNYKTRLLQYAPETCNSRTTFIHMMKKKTKIRNKKLRFHPVLYQPTINNKGSILM